jgi:hypothetical protein
MAEKSELQQQQQQQQQQKKKKSSRNDDEDEDTRRASCDTEPETAMEAFFTRAGLCRTNADVCHEFIDSHFPGSRQRPAPLQGYCSYTVFVDEHLIIQFRPPNYKLDIDLCTSARTVFGDQAPQIEDLGIFKALSKGASGGSFDSGADVSGYNGTLHAYSLSRVPGVPLPEFLQSLLSNPTPPPDHRAEMIRDYARHFSLAWQSKRWKDDPDLRLGTVGSSMHARLFKILSGLPGHFIPALTRVQGKFHRILELPFVLTHGDLLPSNVMIHPETGRLSGLVDWAEAEWLPFGVGMYGLEELLGEDADGTGFHYYPDASKLRELFWTEIQKALPMPYNTLVLMEDVKMAQLLGILLWHGIAFDDGRLNRVVQVGTDDAEIQKLDAFLLGAQQSHFRLRSIPKEGYIPGPERPTSSTRFYKRLRLPNFFCLGGRFTTA